MALNQSRFAISPSPMERAQGFHSTDPLLSFTAIRIDDLSHRPKSSCSSVLQPKGLRAPLLQLIEVMGRQHKDTRLVDKLFNTLLRLGHEMLVSSHYPFVHQNDFWYEASRYSKRQSHHHAARVRSDRHIQIIAELRKIRNRFQFLLYFCRR